MFVVPTKPNVVVDQSILALTAKRHHASILVQVGMLFRRITPTSTFYQEVRRVPFEIGVTTVRRFSAKQAWLHTRVSLRFNTSGSQLLCFGPYCEDPLSPAVPLEYSHMIPRSRACS